MKNLKKIQQSLLEAANKLSLLEKEVDKKQAQQPYSSLRIPVLFPISFNFTPYVGTSTIDSIPLVQQKTITNGAEDAYITQIIHNVTFAGTAPLWTSAPREAENNFNFKWNFRVGSSQASYLSTANEISFCSRRALGFPELANPLSFSKPLLFKAGDSITVDVQCVLNSKYMEFAWPPPPGVSPDVLAKGRLVFITFAGYRDGVLA